ncbi:spore gernimation protein GerPD [Paenibacillus abyssi]|uniref:Spore germination protein GerPD n=1 Tax=Paenibacillus abyssi TaxID=1340531 RepID=A0A917D5L7_9BACL|nr:spore gernimation protein GerPD [Paenibacillus abyssi]GGG09807.1 putative spore germination protein GerPD [Paenibacillus abyssi]
MKDSFKMEVVNNSLHVGQLRIIGVGSSSVVLVGDTEIVSCSSIFDTPLESLLIGPLVPFAPES